MVKPRPAPDADPLLPPAACAQPLRGLNVAILCDESQRADVLALQRAASALGARVALVPARIDGETLVNTGRVLGRLYDALVCIAPPPDLVHELGEAAGVPVVSAAAWSAADDLLRALRSATGR